MMGENVLSDKQPTTHDQRSEALQMPEAAADVPGDPMA